MSKNILDDENAENNNSNSGKNEELDQIKINEASAVSTRKKEIYNSTYKAIIALILIIIILILGTVGYVVCHIDKLPEIKDIWHIYLISVLALSTLLSGVIYLNKSTWSDKKEDSPNDILTALTKVINAFKK